MTPADLQTMRLLAQGLNRKEIAALVKRSKKAVDCRVRHLKDCLRMESVFQLGMFWERNKDFFPPSKDRKNGARLRHDKRTPALRA